TCEPIDACQVAVRPGEAGDETKPDRIFGGDEDDGNRRGCRLRRERRESGNRDDHGYLAASQIGRQLRQLIDLILGEAIRDCYVLALDKAGLLQTLVECPQTGRDSVKRGGMKKPDDRHPLALLRACRERPRSRGAEHRDELTAFHHSITSSARVTR